jgi:hypothetical protein
VGFASGRDGIDLLVGRRDEILMPRPPWKNRSLLLAALVLLSASGLLLHLRIHWFLRPDKQHPGQTIFFGSLIWASLLPLLDVVLVTALFLRRGTAVYGYILNGFIVIYGTVMMTHFSLADLVGRSAPAADYLIRSTLPDIGLAWADFLIGKLLYQSWLREERTAPLSGPAS